MQVSFAQNTPWWAAAGLAAACVGLVVWFYRRHASSIPARYLKALLALRIAAIILVLMFFLRPTLTYVHAEGEKGPLVVLVDKSRSMSVKDAPGLPERLERAASALLSEGGLVEAAGKRFDLTVVAFDRSHDVLGDPGDLSAMEPSGEMTDITAAVSFAAELVSGSARPRAVLVTDGNHNATTTAPVDSVPPGLVLDCVGVGIPHGIGQALKDIEVGDTVLPERVGVGVKIRVGVRVDAGGYAGRHSRAIIKDAVSGRTLGEAGFVLDGIVGDQEIPVDVTFDSVGRRNLVAEVPVEEDEAVTGNNRIPFSVQVTEESTRVLYMEGQLGPEGKFLRRLMLKDPDIESVFLVRVGKDRFLSQGSVGGTTLSAVPTEKGVMSMFDVFLLNNIPESSLTPRQQQMMADLVSNDGKGLLMIAGESSYASGGWASSPLAPLLPVHVDKTAAPVTGSFPMALTTAGLGSPLVEPLRAFIEHGNMPPMELLHAASARTGSEILLAVADASAEAAGSPVLVTAGAGRGRSAVLLALPTYNWRTLPGDTHGLFWRGLLRFLAGKDVLKEGEAGIILDVPKPEFMLGETVPVSARIRDAAGVLSDTASVSAEWTRTDTGETGFLTMASVGTGEYRANFTPPAVGDYKLVASASIENEPVPSASVDFHVGRKDLEFERIGLNRDMLHALAARTGGMYVSVDALDDLVSALVEHSQIKERRTVFNPGHSPFAYLLLILLISLEWYTRRRLELA
ncbi:MAG: hypothetical protein JW909_01405 [Planctomycetes bacterium]|nr:hypothetical protein [Planctomycetota bacterium]